MTTTAKQNSTCTLQLCKNPHSSEDKFKATIIKAVDESFLSFNTCDKEIIYLHLENTFKIKKQEIPCKIEAFADALEQMFGVGAKMIEIRIIEAIHNMAQDFVFIPEKSDVVFKEYVASLRSFLLHTL